ncbi:bifunctional homocysteine S-methyltransferase/methylenetetrahydrofolate reductase [Desertibacillus haloalkaliphilus]|uniref:bifunctional homocysteine S-methyltransferase/methylenetetrahydrofolate reductase n=1 Tax=Desertibacillus haloalkaliphilus TaxID=1328930 RepID=UPI001C280DEF|nr:bifunctional homocysteine S-methyltransferase/methylenetetrahydrofolate reductase [Desertibacillus haloalkaliphilus]MBU8907218.1 bifunctional homocysteine S-methyltransferase/methylenetetrahydrofolate reductase [Desertibacillus haloalkaliphilus]
MNLLKDLQEKILIGDGAMGTLLYHQGVDRCYEELNLSNPERIADIHQSYLDAGAQVLQTNSYAANELKLSRYGLEDQVSKINKAAVAVAKQVAGKDAYVLGTIGGVRGIQKKDVSMQDVTNSFYQQFSVLAEERVDGLLLETYYDFEEIKTVLKLARNYTDMPIIAQVSLGEVGVLHGGMNVADALSELAQLGANVVGINCHMGPYHTIRSLEEVPLFDHAYLSAYPNASLPDYRDGRFVYQSNPSYFADSALRLREQGVRLLGGCCGTTPEHIAAMANAVNGLTPVNTKVVKSEGVREKITTIEPQREEAIHEVVSRRKSVIVELDPPKKLTSIDKFLEGAKQLKISGVDAITMADNSLASPRIDNMALGSILKNDLQTRPLVHVTCRDRNLIGLQSHLMGLHTLGINQLLAVTGDPTKVGDFPGASSVYDLSSFDLIRMIKQLNEGISFSGKALGEKTNFSVAAAFNPNVRHLERAVKRLEKKIDCGADYFMSQPIYSKEQIVEVYEATKHLSKPIYIGIMPLTGYRNAEFLHNEVPGIKLTDDIRERMASHGEDREAAQQEGIAIAKDLIDTAYEYFNGIYLITPFLRYEMTVTLTNYVQQKDIVNNQFVQ